MTTKDFPKRTNADVQAVWLGRAYLEARDRGISPLPPPAHPAPDRIGIGNPNATTTRWEWDTDLPAPESAAFDDIAGAAQRGIDLALYVAIKPDIATMQTFLGITTPTLAQNSAATKAIIRVLRALMRD